MSSYPKSGNTWVRALLCNYFSGKQEPISINELSVAPFGVRRELFEDLVGLETSDLLEEEITAVRPAVYRYLSEQAGETLYCKIHDAYTRIRSGELLFPPEATQASIYLIRNPLDVAVSFAHHQGWSAKDAVQAMADEHYGLALSSNSLDQQIPQRLGAWSAHVLSWADQTDSPLLVLRYEDILEDAAACLIRILEFLTVPICPQKVAMAAEFSSFEQLKKQEQKEPFLEKNPAALNFFRKGGSGHWRHDLPSDLADKVRQNHGAVMRRFGYL